MDVNQTVAGQTRKRDTAPAWQTLGWVEVLANVLAVADADLEPPRLGGMARPDGVVIASERYWAVARTDGAVIEGKMPSPHPAFRRIPLLRGIVRLGAAFAPLAGRGGAAGRVDRPVLLASVLAPVGFGQLPDPAPVVGGAVVVVALLAWLFRGRTLHLHGAEHRVIAAVEERRTQATWSGAAKPSRYSSRCGTNLAVLAMAVFVLCYCLTPMGYNSAWSAALFIPVLGATMELWSWIQRSRWGLARVWLLPGLALQRLTTREPSLEETRLALVAVASVLVREWAEPESVRSPSSSPAYRGR